MVEANDKSMPGTDSPVIYEDDWLSVRARYSNGQLYEQWEFKGIFQQEIRGFWMGAKKSERIVSPLELVRTIDGERKIASLINANLAEWKALRQQYIECEQKQRPAKFLF